MNSFDEENNRRKKNPFDFMDDETFERIFDEVQNMFESQDFKDMLEDMFRNGMNPDKKFVQGFSMNIGPDGKPRFHRMGNKKVISPQGKPTVSEQQEPLTDVIEGIDDVAITVEIPGVQKDEIDLNVTKNQVELLVDTPNRKYQKTLDLPCEVKPKTTKATYNNGVLDVVIQRKDRKRDGSKFKVNIE